MCVVSMIMDHYGDKWRDRHYRWPESQPDPQDWQTLLEQFQPKTEPRITDEEIREFRQLLDRAREYDKRNSEPDCELDSKKETLKQLAKQLGVEIDFL
jgi:hypothetical protein